MVFTVLRHLGSVNAQPLLLSLNLPGYHNVQNALAAIAVATELGVSDEAIISALGTFGGVGRRFSVSGPYAADKGGNFTVVDDYGHHPVEMAATLAAARGAWPDKRIVLVFQPHRYTRTRDCFEDFVKVIGTADAVLLTEVYAASESALVAADGRSLARGVRVAGKVEPLFIEDVHDLPAAMRAFAIDGDVFVVMGAGSISKVPALLGEQS